MYIWSLLHYGSFSTCSFWIYVVYIVLYWCFTCIHNIVYTTYHLMLCTNVYISEQERTMTSFSLWRNKIEAHDALLLKANALDYYTWLICTYNISGQCYGIAEKFGGDFNLAIWWFCIYTNSNQFLIFSLTILVEERQTWYYTLFSHSLTVRLHTFVKMWWAWMQLFTLCTSIYIAFVQFFELINVRQLCHPRQLHHR